MIQHIFFKKIILNWIINVKIKSLNKNQLWRKRRGYITSSKNYTKNTLSIHYI
jgi:hypothetical protein